MPNRARVKLPGRCFPCAGSKSAPVLAGWSYFITFSCELLIPEAPSLEASVGENSMQGGNEPHLLSSVLPSFHWNFLSFPPSILRVCTFEIAGVWVISDPKAVAPVCLFLYKYIFERKKLVPVTFSQRMSQVPSDLWGREFWVHSLPTFSFGVRINWQVKNYFRQQTLPVATVICNLRRQMPRFGVPGSHAHLTAQMCPPRFHLWASFPTLDVHLHVLSVSRAPPNPPGSTLHLRTATLPSCAHTCSCSHGHIS